MKRERFVLPHIHFLIPVHAIPEEKSSLQGELCRGLYTPLHA